MYLEVFMAENIQIPKYLRPIKTPPWNTIFLKQLKEENLDELIWSLILCITTQKCQGMNNVAILETPECLEKIEWFFIKKLKLLKEISSLEESTTVKPVLSGHSKVDEKKGGSLMQVLSIAEHSAILLTCIKSLFVLKTLSFVLFWVAV